MLNTLQTSDFEMRSRNQDLNFELLKRDLENLSEILENLWLRLVNQSILKKHPLLKMEADIHLRLMKHPLLKMKDNIHLKLSRLPFSKNQLDSIHSRPP